MIHLLFRKRKTMYKPATKIYPYLILAIVVTACQKELSQNSSEDPSSQDIRATGALPDDAAALAKTPLIVSFDFYQSGTNLRKRLRDTDGDGIPDASDACPQQKETVNGYLDGDGCPDTAPAPSGTETDTDGDGIVDAQDLCPTEPETFNNYQDSDGCPDTVPTVVEPTTLPYSVDLTMPSVGHQGSEGSCVAWAASYARSAEEYYQTSASGYDPASNITSPEFLFNQIKTDENCSGSAMLTALEFLRNNGICTWQSMPYSSVNGCSLAPTTEQITEALNYKIDSYSKAYTSDLAALKTLLATNHPLLVTFSIDDNFKNAQPGYIWKSFSGTPSLVHAVAICGYDDSKNAFKIINSWGTAWGDQGYLWIDYNFLANSLANFVFVMN